MNHPTQIIYHELQIAFNHFNKKLFNGKNPNCMITLHRKKQSMGFFASRQFIKNDTAIVCDEIAMNPMYFIQPLPLTMSTLVHEMAHQYQFHFGKPGRGKYHNKEWAKLMKTVGLMPSKTGEFGGKETGDSMSHYILKNGFFEKACNELLTTDFCLSWLDRFPSADALKNLSSSTLKVLEDNGVVLPEETQNKNKKKYVCEKCGIQVWGKPLLEISCIKCDLVLKNV